MVKVMDPAKLKAASTYNAAADHFDDDPLAFWDRYGRGTIEHLALAPGATVLDVGCGSGASAIPAAKAVGPHGHVIGVDLADRLLAIARAKAISQKLKNIEFRQGDMEKLEFSDASFDAVVCVFAIFFLPDMVKQVRELWRMIRPGGQLAITTWGPRMFEPGSAAWWAAVKQFRPDLHSAFNPWERITTPEALRQLLADAGIQEAQVVAENGWQVLHTPNDWWTVVLGSGYRWTVEQMDDTTVERVRKENIDQLKKSQTKSIETNVIYAVALKE
ncbi:MAG TPA: class I SAM-dependent methyltransferase [Pseudolabrys sp.]|nr:class I SAM-dependent methyltransferase [Pseudolabrys sp.]